MKYWVGYYCPIGSGHFVMTNEKPAYPHREGWGVFLDADYVTDRDNPALPEGEWVE